jgi:hypothetical protein
MSALPVWAINHETDISSPNIIKLNFNVRFIVFSFASLYRGHKAPILRLESSYFIAAHSCMV